VTLRLENGLPNLRERATFKQVKDVLRKFAEYCSIRIVHFSVQKNHFHLIVEAESWRALSSAIRSLEIQLAWAINAIAGRRGRVFKHRYDVVELSSPRHVRNGLVYVLGNARKHAAQAGVTLPAFWIDPYSSGGWFDGWSKQAPLTPQEEWPRAKLWLLTTGWRRHGLVRVDEAPAV
jgi:REP element-mobilizing transposase RayT